jgi:hypothetical protein
MAGAVDGGVPGAGAGLELNPLGNYLLLLTAVGFTRVLCVRPAGWGPAPLSPKARYGGVGGQIGSSEGWCRERVPGRESPSPRLCG